MALNEIETGLPIAVQCRVTLDVKNATYLACVNEGNTQCSNVTNSYVQTKSLLETQTVQSLEQLANQTMESCSTRLQQLQYLISQVIPNNNALTLILNGTSTVTVQGAASFQANYEVYQFTVGGFQLDYLTLLPWTDMVNTATNNPSITYSGMDFLGTQIGTRFLLNKQQEAFQGSNVVAYTIEGPQLVFHGTGNGDFKLIKRFMIF